jgi:hypothetical protein
MISLNSPSSSSSSSSQQTLLAHLQKVSRYVRSFDAGRGQFSFFISPATEAKSNNLRVFAWCFLHDVFIIIIKTGTRILMRRIIHNKMLSESELQLTQQKGSAAEGIVNNKGILVQQQGNIVHNYGGGGKTLPVQQQQQSFFASHPPSMMTTTIANGSDAQQPQQPSHHPAFQLVGGTAAAVSHHPLGLVAPHQIPSLAFPYPILQQQQQQPMTQVRVAAPVPPALLSMPSLGTSTIPPPLQQQQLGGQGLLLSQPGGPPANNPAMLQLLQQAVALVSTLAAVQQPNMVVPILPVAVPNCGNNNNAPPLVGVYPAPCVQAAFPFAPHNNNNMAHLPVHLASTSTMLNGPSPL